ncbi:MAG: TPM domain-containing protein [Lachnospiraceae bacterium]|nr:TPM domain-containing protein [Lachnospiraceae bacterium]
MVNVSKSTCGTFKNISGLCKALTLVMIIVLFAAFSVISTGKAASADSLGVPDETLADYEVYDAEGFIKDKQLTNVKNKMKEIYDTYGVHTYVIISTKIGMSDDYEGYLEDLHKRLPSLDAVALIIGYKENDHVYCLRSYGHGNITDCVLTTSKLKGIQDDMKPTMKEKKFAKSSLIFLEESEEILATYDPNKDYPDSEIAENPMFAWYVSLLIALVISSLIFGIWAGSSGMKVTTSSTTYLDNDNSRVVSGFSRFTHKTVTRTKRSESSSSGGGGGGHSSGGSGF